MTPPAPAPRPSLPPLPAEMRHLPVDGRGFPVPWFVAWVDGKPDHRIADPRKINPAVLRNLCWTCGERITGRPTFVTGLISLCTMVVSEPPNHEACAEYAVKACPFLSRPNSKRREANMPAGALHRPDGIAAASGGVTITVAVDAYTLVPAAVVAAFSIANPAGIKFWCEGRPATAEDVHAVFSAAFAPGGDLERTVEAHSREKLKGQPEAAVLKDRDGWLLRMAARGLTHVPPDLLRVPGQAALAAAIDQA